MKNTETKALPGIMLTAGSTIGAGMLSLPIVSSGMWWSYSLLCLLFVWFLNYMSSLYVLEANTHFEPGASFDTVASQILGKRWNTLIGISVAFLLYILMYAYFSAFGSMAAKTFGLSDANGPNWLIGLIGLAIGSLLAAVVWLSTSAVGRISTILVVGMIIAFAISMAGFSFHIETIKLFDQESTVESSYLVYLWAALPYFMTSFGFVTVVPSLYKFYGKNVPVIKKSLFFGSLIAFLVYTLFITVAFGNISRADFIPINASGGDLGLLIKAFGQEESSSIVSIALDLFSNFAIITSFLGVGLCLFDYIADKFSLNDDHWGRFKGVCLAFLPAGFASLFFPHGFIAAIGFAGLVMLFGFFIAPYFMIRKIRRNSQVPLFRVKGGHSLLTIFLVGSLLIGACKILTMLQYLPQW